MEGSFSILIPKSDLGRLSLDPWVWSYPEWPEALQPSSTAILLLWGILFWGWEVPEGGDTGLCSQMRHR